VESRRATLEPTAKAGFAVDPVLGCREFIGRPDQHRSG
jgi:hypothetical protein